MDLISWNNEKVVIGFPTSVGVTSVDLGFLEGGDFGNPSERSKRALRGSGITREGFGSRRGTKPSK